jgi:hypothetical protein
LGFVLLNLLGVLRELYELLLVVQLLLLPA